jgi:hypothetical protein
MFNTTIEYLGKKFDVDYEVTEDRNGDDEIQIESIKFCGDEMIEFLECVYTVTGLTVTEEFDELVYQQHKEPSPEYDSTQVEDE